MHAGGAQIAHDLPHLLAQLHVDARRRLVEEQDLRLVRLSALAIMTRRFMPPDSVMMRLSFLSHSVRSRSTFSM